ncbi:MAG: DUF3604 domain-containing protein, partial [Clostridia bacterium]
LLKKGETITLRIGDTTKGGPGSETYWTAGKSYLFLEAGLSDGEALPVDGMPFAFEIVAREDKAFLRILGPTIAVAGDPQRIHLGVFDRCGNLMDNFNKAVVLEGKELEMPGGNGILDGVTFSKEGSYRLKAYIKGEKAEYFSNPITVVKQLRDSIYWGDLHAHGWGDSSMHLMHVNNDKISPLARHRQAMNIGRLDFSSPGPMSFPEKDKTAIWDEYKAACRESDIPGKYVPFLAYEAHPVPEGDRNVIFRDLNEGIPPDYRISMAELEDKYGAREDVFLQVHIGGRIPKWGEYMPVRERLVEVASGFGNAEWLLQEALDRGFMPAVCGCSDLHYGLMGGPRTVEESRGRFGGYLNKRDSAYGTGPVTAVRASSLNREAIWNALEKRHTYATSGHRAYLDLVVNGCSYGDEADEAEIYDIFMEYKGTDSIFSVSLVSGKYIMRTFMPDSDEFKVRISVPAAETGGDFIYMKVLQRDGGFAISSPVYIKRNQSAWNAGDVFSMNASEAAAHEKALVRYLAQEEDISRFTDIRPIGIIDEKITKCALFHARFGGRDVSIRWYYEYEIPRIRMDWGYSGTGPVNDEIKYNV